MLLLFATVSARATSLIPEASSLNKNWKRVALPEHLPYHLGIAGDKEGRIVVFENGYAWKTHDVSFRLYAPDGKLLSTYKIDPGEFEPARPPRFRNGYAYGWLTKKGRRRDLCFRTLEDGPIIPLGGAPPAGCIDHLKKSGPALESSQTIRQDTRVISPSVLAAILAIVFLAALVRGAFGFGDALIGMPLLALFVPLTFATPLMALVGPTLAVLIPGQGMAIALDVRGAGVLIASTLAGIPVGLWGLKRIDGRIVNLILAVVIILFALYSLLHPGLLRLRTARSAPLFGFTAGVLGAAYNTNGPPVIFYGALRGWAPESFRATLQGYFLPTGTAILISGNRRDAPQACVDVIPLRSPLARPGRHPWPSAEPTHPRRQACRLDLCHHAGRGARPPDQDDSLTDAGFSTAIPGSPRPTRTRALQRIGAFLRIMRANYPLQARRSPWSDAHFSTNRAVACWAWPRRVGSSKRPPPGRTVKIRAPRRRLRRPPPPNAGPAIRSTSRSSKPGPTPGATRRATNSPIRRTGAGSVLAAGQPEREFVRMLEMGVTLPWMYEGTPYQKVVDPNGITTEYVRC